MSLSLFSRDPFFGDVSPRYSMGFPSMLSSLTRGSDFPAARASAAGAPLCCSVAESPTEYTVLAEVPGVNKEDIKVSVENGMLNIAIERYDELEDADDFMQWSERRYGKSSRSFRIPRDVDENSVNAERGEHGILTIKLPKQGRERMEQIKEEESSSIPIQ
eukprot:210722_1